MQCHLVYLTGPNAGQAKNFDAARITIGRASTCDFQFDPNKDLAVASLHAEILLDEDTFYIHDADSRGGTYVNGFRITQPLPLRSEDYLQFGKNGPEVIFRLGMAPPGHQPLPPEPPRMAELEFLTGADAGKVFAVYGDQLTRVGRRADLEVALDPRGDMVVSGNHCSIACVDGRFYLTDTSRNGTFVNGRLIQGRVSLQDGDVITLGEGGPRARFHIRPTRRSYPNETLGRPAVSPQDLDEPTPVEQPAVRPPAVPAGPGAVARAVPRPPTSPSAMPPSTPTSTSPVSPPGSPSASSPQPAKPQAQARAAIPAPPENPPTVTPAEQPDAPQPVAGRRPRRKFPYAPVVGGLALVFALTAVGWYIATRPPVPTAPLPPVATADLSAQIAAGKTRRNETGRFLVKIPQGWNNVREDGPILSAESPDKAIVVDYIRDPRLQQVAVQTVVALPDAQVQKIDSRKVGDVTFTSFVSSAAGRSRYAVLHEPAGDVPGLAMLETSSEVFQKLPRTAIHALTREGFRLQFLASPSEQAAQPTPTPEPTQVAQPATPTPQPTPPPPATTPQPTEPPPTPAPTPTATPQAAPPPTPTPAPPSAFNITSDRIRIQLTLPVGWSGESLADGQVLLLRSPSGVNIRLTRDPKSPPAKAVFDAMAGDGWDIIARNENRRVGPLNSDLAEMKKGTERLILVLLGYPDKSTVYIYASNPDKFLAPQREDLSRLIQTLAAQEPEPTAP